MGEMPPPSSFRLHWSVDGRSGLPQALPIPWTLERLKSFIRLITPSPNRGFDVILSAGFTRAISICGKVVLLGLVISMGGNSSVGREEPLIPILTLNNPRLPNRGARWT
jgi:hypothetical protein